MDKKGKERLLLSGEERSTCHRNMHKKTHLQLMNEGPVALAPAAAAAEDNSSGCGGDDVVVVGPAAIAIVVVGVVAVCGPWP